MTNLNKQKKVLHIITGLNDGGAEGVLTRLCLHSKQLQHVVVSLIDAGKYGPLLTDAGVTVHCLGMNPGKPSLTHLFCLIKLIRKERPDVVQTWMYHADLLGGIAARLAGVRRTFWGVRHSTLDKGKSKRSTILIARLCAILSKWVPEKIICCAHKALEAHTEIGYEPSKLLVIPNGYDLTRFKPDPIAATSAREELGLKLDEFVLGKVGRFDPLKDHFNLLQALALVARQQVKFKCLLVGKGLSPDNESLVTRIAELDLQDTVTLAGQRTDIPVIMNALDLHVLSSISEGFPNVIAEAMASGTPCVSTNVGDALEIIGDAEACCQASDPEALANLIHKMYNEWARHPNVWEDRKALGVRHIQAKFSIKGMVDAYEFCWLQR